MKVVLFCGGLGTRLREHSDTIPKPLVNVGVRPIMWHLMRYYAHYGHKEFILCLGYRGEMIREYFLNYSESLSNDFVMSDGGRTVLPQKRDIEDWRITFVDTGLHANIAQRLLKVRPYLEQDEEFLANYSDALTDLPLDEHVARFREKRSVASLIATRTSQSFHCVKADDNDNVKSIGRISDSEFWINSGFFCLRKEIFDYIEPGDELVERPFQRLIEKNRLSVTRYEGFWQQMDTLRDKIVLDRMEGQGNCPWMVWKR
jgi:glucose-1-phosphate cytidylyltransferase